MNNEELSRTTTTVVDDIKTIIDKGRAAAYAAVNTTMIAEHRTPHCGRGTARQRTGRIR